MYKDNTNFALLSEKNGKISFSAGLVVLIGIFAFVLGLAVGIICSPKSKKKKAVITDTEAFNASEYAKSLDFKDDEEGTLAFEF